MRRHNLHHIVSHKVLRTLRWFALGAVAVSLSASGVFAGDAKCEISPNEKVIALNEIQNLMGRYAHLGQLRGEGTLAELFAMKTEGVSWRTPGGPVGIEQMKQRFARPDEVLQPGVLHMHSMFTPVIEVAGDGKTAKGVWDSFGANINNGETVGNWLWMKYGVDFVKEDNVWKIWHLQVYPIFNTPYDKSITQSAKERREAAAKQPPVPAAQPQGDDVPIFMRNRPANLWQYDGVSVERGPYIPEPYCHFDSRTTY